MKRQRKSFYLTCLSPFILFSLDAHAKNPTSTEVTLGVGVQSAAKYSGSDEESVNVLPYLRLQNGDYFLDTEKGIGYEHSWDNGIYVSQLLGYTTGRKESDSDWELGSDKLKGMGNIKSALNSTTTLGWQVSSSFWLEGNIIAPLTDSQGMQYNAGFKYNLMDGSADTIVLSSKANFGDARYLNTFYGVSSSQSEHSGFRKYHAGGGLYSVDTDLTWTHFFGENWSSYANVTYSQLTNKAKDSPIAFRDNNTALTAGVLYTFK